MRALGCVTVTAFIYFFNWINLNQHKHDEIQYIIQTIHRESSKPVFLWVFHRLTSNETILCNEHVKIKELIGWNKKLYWSFCLNRFLINKDWFNTLSQLFEIDTRYWIGRMLLWYSLSDKCCFYSSWGFHMHTKSVNLSNLCQTKH